jgi:hypothetical protein
MKSMQTVVAAALLALGFGVLPNTPVKAQGAVVGEQTELKATVETVDQSTRTVLLRGDDGSLATCDIGPEVRNLAQVKAGDRVVLRIRSGVLATMAPANGAGAPVERADVAGRAAKGSKPGGYEGEATRVRVTFNGYDAKTKTVTYTLPSGEQHSTMLRTKSMRDFAAGLKAADKVDVTFARSMAVAVLPAQ